MQDHTPDTSEGDRIDDTDGSERWQEMRVRIGSSLVASGVDQKVAIGVSGGLADLWEYTSRVSEAMVSLTNAHGDSDGAVAALGVARIYLTEIEANLARFWRAVDLPGHALSSAVFPSRRVHLRTISQRLATAWSVPDANEAAREIVSLRESTLSLLALLDSVGIDESKKAGPRARSRLAATAERHARQSSRVAARLAQQRKSSDE